MHHTGDAECDAMAELHTCSVALTAHHGLGMPNTVLPNIALLATKAGTRETMTGPGPVNRGSSCSAVRGIALCAAATHTAAYSTNAANLPTPQRRSRARALYSNTYAATAWLMLARPRCLLRNNSAVDLIRRALLSANQEPSVAAAVLNTRARHVGARSNP